MAFLVSPGVEVKEIDRSGYISAQSTSIGAYAGHFAWGPIGYSKVVSSETEMRDEYGSPNYKSSNNLTYARSWYTASGFLNYSNSLRISRAGEDPARYGSTVESFSEDDVTYLNTSEESFAGTTNSYWKEGADGITEWNTYDSVDPLILLQASSREQISTLDELNEVALYDTIFGRFPGSYANGLSVYFIDKAIYDDHYNTTGDSITLPSNVLSNVQYAPDRTEWADTAVSGDSSGINDELHIIIVDTLGKFTKEPGSILEVFTGLSKAANSLNSYNESNYFVKVINDLSAYIWLSPLSVDTTIERTDTSFDPDLIWDSLAGVVGDGSLKLDYGQDGNNTTDSPGVTLSDTTWTSTYNASSSYGSKNIVSALDTFRDPTFVDINLLFAENFGGRGLEEIGDNIAEQTPIDNAIANICLSRRDCVGFISAPLSIINRGDLDSKRDAVVNKFNAVPSNNYLIFDSSPGKVYNRDKDEYIWIPLCGHMAGLCAYTDDVTDPWFSPAGLNRGNLRGVVQLAYNPGQADRDILYPKRINPIVSFPGQGIVLYGDKTGQTKPSAFDRINVRRLFLTVEKAIANYAKYSLFEQNDEFTRAAFVNAITPYLRDVQARRGIAQFKVVCDRTNNTSEVINNNRMVATIYINPVRSINFITLNFVATRDGASFTELTTTSVNV